jgi:hypothetical protein
MGAFCSSEVSDLTGQITLAIHLNRTDELVPLAKDLLQVSPKLTPEGRWAFYRACHQTAVSIRRSVAALDHATVSQHTPEEAAIIQQVISRLRAKLEYLRQEVWNLTQPLIDQADTEEALAHYWLIRADFARYTENENAERFYIKAASVAQALSKPNLVRLTVVLNHAIYLGDVVKNKDRAVLLANQVLPLDLPQNAPLELTALKKVLEANVERWGGEVPRSH